MGPGVRQRHERVDVHGCGPGAGVDGDRWHRRPDRTAATRAAVMDVRRLWNPLRRRRGHPRRRRSLLARSATAAIAATLSTHALCHAAATPDVFYTGGDVSRVPFMQQQGVVFRDAGVARPPATILYDPGAHLFRVRL